MFDRNDIDHVRLDYVASVIQPSWREVEACVTLEKACFGRWVGYCRLACTCILASSFLNTSHAQIHIPLSVELILVFQLSHFGILFWGQLIRLQHQVWSLRTVHLLKLCQCFVCLNHARTLLDDRQSIDFSNLQRCHYQCRIHLLSHIDIVGLARTGTRKNASQYDVPRLCLYNSRPHVQYRRAGSNLKQGT